MIRQMCLRFFTCSVSRQTDFHVLWKGFSAFSVKVNSLIAAWAELQDPLCCADCNLSWNGWKQKSSLGAGSDNGFWLGRTTEFGRLLSLFEILSTAHVMWHPYKLYKGVLQGVLLRGNLKIRIGIFLFFFSFSSLFMESCLQHFWVNQLCRLWEILGGCSVSDWSYCWANIWDQLQADQICKTLLSSYAPMEEYKSMEEL